MAHAVERLIVRLNRAEDLLHAVKDEINAFLATPLFDSVVESDRQGRIVVRSVNVREPPGALSVRIGECVHTYRSTLDHLAYRLAVLHSGEPLPSKIETTSMFPIASSGPRFRKQAYRICGMSPRAQRIVEQLQPYHRRRLPDARSLLALDQLNNVDKHRDLHPTAAALAGTQFQIGGTGLMRLSKIEAFPHPLRERSLLARFTGEFEGDIEVSMPNARFDVLFGPNCAAPVVRGASVMLTLAEAREFILGQVMPAFAEELGVEFLLAGDEAAEEPPPGP